MKDCLFCKIVEGSIPADVVAETDHVLAFNDINPVAPTHVLIIPKRHVADSAGEITSAEGGLLAEIFITAAGIARERQLDQGWRVVTNVGPAAGQTVFHLHFHLMGGWAEPQR
ncbi:MAG: histidine triad nucleotide-binding protein [Actinobacteria bacterium]|nr:histidine triad nucleotide-binding protein [Actinomycetota bacterium]